jgi:hypothetical protein
MPTMGTATMRNQGFTMAFTTMADTQRKTNWRNLCIEMQSFWKLKRRNVDKTMDLGPIDDHDQL